MERVLIATRGEIARRLIVWFRERDIETVSVFSEIDADQPWVDEADYSTYLPGRTVAETYANPDRVLSAAADAGCDVIHPGYCFLATHLGFFQAAASANIAVVGTSMRALEASLNRSMIEEVCRKEGIPRIPSSSDLGETDDGVAEAAQMGFPLLVKASSGGARLRVDTPEELPVAVAAVRLVAEATTGNPAVYLQRHVPQMRTLSTLVFGDQHGACEALGHVDGSARAEMRSWVETIGEGVVPDDLAERLHEKSVAFARGLGWVGVGRVVWAITPRSGWYLLGFSPRLPIGYSLVEQALGVDLLRTQIALQSGEPLGWDDIETTPKEHFLQVRVLHVDPATGKRPEGTITRYKMPKGVYVEAGTAKGMPATDATDPLLCKITVGAPTRQAALVRMRAALNELRIDGVPTNREALMDFLADADVWQHPVDTNALPAFLARRG
jgi:acetyl/propionyl-CoA carboxylase alpha subunit